MEEGTRSGLWRHFFQAIKGLRPRGVIIENVAALAGKGLDRVLRDLASIGYDAEWDVIAAAGVGAPHLRERMFIIAWPRGGGVHMPWGEPPVSADWMCEPEGVPRLVGDVANRPARLRCLGNAVVPQVAAHVARLLRARIDAGARGYSTPDDIADARHKTGKLKGKSKIIAYMATPMFDPGDEFRIDGKRLPRAGRLTANVVYERERSCTQAHAKATGLAYMAPTLRPRADGVDGLYPTPVSSDDNKTPDAHIAMKARMGGGRKQITSLQVLSKVDGFRLIPTPTATDADSSRRASAMRDKEWTSNPGETLLDYADPTNGGKLLPTPCAADGDRASDSYMRGNPTLQGSARLLPTPTAQDAKNNGAASQMDRNSLPLNAAVKLLPTPCAADASGSRATKGADRPNEGGLQHHARLLPTPKATDGDKGVRSYQGAVNEMARGKGGDLDTAAKLLPTPRPCSGLRSSGMNRTEMMNALAETEGARLLPTPTSSDGGACFDGQSREGGGNLTGAAKLLPTPVSGDHRTGWGERYGPGERRANLNDATTKLEEQSIGRLGPEWVSWVMGYPVDWTEL